MSAAKISNVTTDFSPVIPTLTETCTVCITTTVLPVLILANHGFMDVFVALTMRQQNYCGDIALLERVPNNNAPILDIIKSIR
jgi:hypothetical protein